MQLSVETKATAQTEHLMLCSWCPSVATHLLRFRHVPVREETHIVLPDRELVVVRDVRVGEQHMLACNRHTDEWFDCEMVSDVNPLSTWGL